MARKSDNFFDEEHHSGGLGRTRLFHPWAHEPEGGGWAPAFLCRTLSDTVRGQGLIPSGHVRVPYESIYNISCTSIRDSRAIRQGPSGPVGSYRVPMGFRRNPDLVRQDSTGLEGSLDCPVLVHN